MTPEEEESIEAIFDHLSDDGPAIIMNEEAAEMINERIGDCLCMGCVMLRAFVNQVTNKETHH